MTVEYLAVCWLVHSRACLPLPLFKGFNVRWLLSGYDTVEVVWLFGTRVCVFCLQSVHLYRGGQTLYLQCMVLLVCYVPYCFFLLDIECFLLVIFFHHFTLFQYYTKLNFIWNYMCSASNDSYHYLVVLNTWNPSISFLYLVCYFNYCSLQRFLTVRAISYCIFQLCELHIVVVNNCWRKYYIMVCISSITSNIS